MASNLFIQANIVEINDGPVYHVLLSSVPHVGELVELRSQKEERMGQEPYHKYRVIQIIHNVWDVPEDTDTGYQKVNIYVEQA